MTPARSKAVASMCRSRRSTAYGLAGSAVAMLLTSLPARKEPMLVIGDSQDDAGYLYFDLCRLVGEPAVAMLPSGYKRDIKYGQADEPSRVLRTETLNRIASGSLRFIVSYPEALAELVASRKSIADHTIKFVKGSTADREQVEQWLRENGFKEEDYVYEPGHYAVRGSILDIFGYSNELPYRIDFFGDEIDSIRTFNVETQLSEQRFDDIAITSSVSQYSRGESLLDYIEPSTTIAVRDLSLTVSRIRAIASEEFSQSAMIANEGDANAMKQVVDAEDFAQKIETFRILEFTSAANLPKEAKAAIDFDCSPQGIYHKNFDLISESFTRLIADGYTLYILSDNEKQFDRLRAIFADRGDDISFVPVNSTLHEGFVDHVRCVVPAFCLYPDMRPL